jgi:hypothetical protein
MGTSVTPQLILALFGPLACILISWRRPMRFVRAGMIGGTVVGAGYALVPSWATIHNPLWLMVPAYAYVGLLPGTIVGAIVGRLWRSSTPEGTPGAS